MPACPSLRQRWEIQLDGEREREGEGRKCLCGERVKRGREAWREGGSGGDGGSVSVWWREVRRAVVGA